MYVVSLMGSRSDMPVNKRALVTGLTGFTGHYVADELAAAGFEVYGMGGHPSHLPRYTQVDLADRDSLHALVARVSPHVVLHLAGIAFVGADNAEAFYRVNTVGTRNLLEALANEAPDVECVLLASSANVYGNATEGVLDESTLPNPANDYAVSKLSMEYMARLWLDRLPIVIARPFNYTGVGQTDVFLLPKIVGHFQRGAKQIELGNLDVYRDFSDVRAVANAYRRLVQACPVGQTVNVCSGKSHSLREVLAMVGKIAGYEIEVKVNPAFVRANEVRSLLGSAARLRDIIGEWNLPQLNETLEWMYHSPAK
ncbi:GDP-6-deoxy-D-talose 4-dehydrogenase [mine drainage metagenome]|uniref:GDP-6-deoxy-D-talose 4-dehydrogenase n=1 Tax=mine drainage metagenome TaxID=410659 RepID=A0A1J5PRP5_9ZZZZ